MPSRHRGSVSWLALVVLAVAPQDLHLERDATFVERGDVRLNLDLARPKERENLPAMLCLHGGGW